MAELEVEGAAAGFIVALLNHGMVDEAYDFWEWFEENVHESEKLGHLVGEE